MSQRAALPFETFADLERAIVARFPGLSRRLRQIAIYALANPGEIALETTTVLSPRAGVQPSSLIRFAQVLGFTGYSQMQTVFRRRLADDLADYHDRSTLVPPAGRRSTSVAGLLDQFVQSDVASLKSLLQDGPTHELIERACALMADARAVYLVAQGTSFPVACYLGYALNQMKVRSVLVDGIGGMLFQQASHARQRDVIVAVTSKTYSADVIQVVRESKKRGVSTIVLADSRVNPLSKHADVMLEAPQREVRAYQSLAVPMTLALTLVVGLGRRLEGAREPAALGTGARLAAGRLQP